MTEGSTGRRKFVNAARLVFHLVAFSIIFIGIYGYNDPYWDWSNENKVFVYIFVAIVYFFMIKFVFFIVKRSWINLYIAFPLLYLGFEIIYRWLGDGPNSGYTSIKGGEKLWDDSSPTFFGIVDEITHHLLATAVFHGAYLIAYFGMRGKEGKK